MLAAVSKIDNSREMILQRACKVVQNRTKTSSNQTMIENCLMELAFQRAYLINGKPRSK